MKKAVLLVIAGLCGAGMSAAAGAEAEAAAAVGSAAEEAAGRKWFSLKAYVDVESAYICRGYVWDRRPFTSQYVEGEADMGAFGRADAYLWTMSLFSNGGHSTPMRYAFCEVDYGLRYFYDVKFSDDWVLVNGVARQWVTNPGVRHGGHSFIDWWAMQTLKNPYVVPYWRMRYSRRPYQAVNWAIGIRREFQLTDDLTLTADFFGELGDNRHYQGLFGPKPFEPYSRYHGGLHALNFNLRLDYRLCDHVTLFAFAGQFGIVSQDARDALKASPAREACCDLTYCGAGVALDF